ncbi:MAG: valine--tRNA ligase [Methylobacteriaceae bacterium]|nr:valine--tRNA ligase [Methylobacteriaceae bacterium]
MDKTFDPAAVEARVAARWEAARAFVAGKPERRHATPYSIVIPPPNVTGSLHIGHALNNTLQDVLVRFERMRGRDVLWQPGTDHAGIATQMVVERQLAAAGQPGRREMGRDAFIQRVWDWKAQSGGAIVGQLKRLGASCDWSRERFTMDEGLSRAVAKVFVDLYRDGLVYRDKRLVNWDPRFGTAISDLEVQQIEVKGHLWYINYPLAGEPDRHVTVATTRPETMLGDVAVAVHPDDERYRGLIGQKLVLPLVGREIPIVADSYSDPEKGTGAVKITPAHDFNDFEVGRRHGLRLINVLGPAGEIRIADNDAFLQDLDPGQDLDPVMSLEGLDRGPARERIAAQLAERGYLAKTEPHVHAVPHGDRSGVVIEPYLTEQWYVDVRPLAERALAAVRDGRTRFVPANWEKTYAQWLENIEPWCVSRQLWWGHQIPAWYGPDGHVFVAETEEQAAADALAHYVVNGTLTEEEGAAIASDPERLAAFLTRDEDVLDTWFSSALWPFSTLGWPNETPELKRFYPTNTLVTAFDIIFFWVARMMMMGLYCTDEVPFDTVYIHALVRDENGQKMSKTKGNVIDPLQLVGQYGADATRFTLAAMAAQGRDVKMSMQRVEGYRNFATKLWNAARFARMNGCAMREAFDPASASGTLNQWALGELARTAREVTAGIEAYRFNEAAGAIYRFTWNSFCDWYLELAKPILQGVDEASKKETQATIAFVLEGAVKLLHPITPFITEELWLSFREGTSEVAASQEKVLALAVWPDLQGLDRPQAEAEIGWLIDLVTEIRSVRAEMNVPAGAQIPLVLIAPGDETKTRLEEWDGVLRRLARLSSIERSDEPPAQSAQILVRGEAAALLLAGVIDIGAERARLSKERDRLRAEIGKIDAKLANADFLKRAPEEVVEEQRERRETALARIAKLDEALKRLG